MSVRIFQGINLELFLNLALPTALTKARCEGIEVAQESSKFHNGSETQIVEKEAVTGTEVKIYRDYSPISKSVAASEAMK
jgi:hypothetical protein